ncbi:GyrI-like domain-containing protein [Sebaldella sp. S0638]|uniref:GyrI-like domain-containing protein n=1 Tax=Sebaldella sp. S0638 TaxID=2957809 RepID=UPI00209E4E22|nr:GyrI-like domain-containing protein [Sebaldella sp. S0638]MCP1223712.1 GyrI-like domain-containing protein [Sebaldella sp. S0638]
MKYDWKKQEKGIYLPKGQPELIFIEKFQYLTLEGSGNPNESLFSELAGTLFSLSYTLKMLPKRGITPDGYFDYAVYPLEGIWDLAKGSHSNETKLDKSKLVYKIMIRQPEFVNEQVIKTAAEILKKKKTAEHVEKVKFEEIEDGQAVQMMHTGSYDSETASFEKMKDFCLENGLKIRSKAHKEIYISNPERTAQEKLKTVLRYFVEK